MAEVRFVMGGRIVGREEAARAAVLVAGAGISDPSTVHAFGDDESFRTWAAASRAKSRLLALDALVARARAEPDRGDAPAARHQEQTEQAVCALLDLGGKYRLQPGSEDLLRRATSDANGTKARFDSLMVLYDGYEFQGSWRPVAGAVPRLDWIGFDDRTSSLWLSGAGVLGQHTGFGGQLLYMLGAPWTRFDRLSRFGFDNRASSAAVL
jgi:hypothetical protein